MRDELGTIRVLLADDHPVVRAGIRDMLADSDDIRVVGEASDGAAVLQALESTRPDVLLLDMEMPGLSGIEVARKVREAHRSVAVIALSAHDGVDYVRGVLEAGAKGYLLKEEAGETIVDAIRGVKRGEDGWLSRGIAARMMAWTREGLPESPDLSAAEREVLRQLVDGKSNREIARVLDRSEKTVERHLSNIYLKLGVESRVEAAVLAVREGLVRS